MYEKNQSKKKRIGYLIMRRSQNAIQHRASILGVKFEYFWSEEKIELLKKYYPIEGKKCYKRFEGISEIQVKSAAIRLKIYRQPLWSVEENEIMRQYYPTEGGNCYKRLNNKTKQQTMHHAKLLKIGCHTINTSADRWTEEDDNIIRQYYPIEGGECYKRIEGSTKATVKGRASFLGVKYISRVNRPCKVLCIETGEIFNSITEAATMYKSSKIGDVCKGKRNTAGKLADGTKLHWKYIEETEDKD